MNGIKEDIKAIGVLDSESAVYQEAIFNLSARLKTLQVNSANYKLCYGQSLYLRDPPYKVRYHYTN